MRAEPARRVDTASRLIRATPRRIYDACVDAASLAQWLPPSGMRAHVEAFEPWPGGAYAMTLTYTDAAHATAGKSSPDADVVRGRFVALVPGERIVQAATFTADDPAFAGEMRITWTLEAAPGGTLVTVSCEDVPAGIRPADHQAGLRSTLENLAAFVERGATAP